MTLSAFGISIDLPNPSFPHNTPRAPEQDATETAGHIYTVTHAPIAPQRITLNISEIEPDQAPRLADFIVYVLQFSAYPCTITTDIATYKNMHLIGGYESVVSKKGDISSARLVFREATDSIAVGKNQLSTPRFFRSDGTLSPEWSATGTTSPPIPKNDSPFSYAHRVIRSGAAAANISLLPAHALPLVGTDLRLRCTYRRTGMRGAATLAVRFYAAATASEAVIAERTAHTGDASAFGWMAFFGDVTQEQFPAGANFFAPIFRMPAGSAISLAEITTEYRI